MSSAALWALADRREHPTAARVGMAGALVGAGMAAGAGAWLASSVGCRADPDCAEGEACREIPAPPGREPYKQCMPR